MDPVMLREHLAQTERHVLEGRRHVARQRGVIAALDRQGADSAAAMTLLRQFEAWLALHVEDRERLRKELGL
jgi:hypothetical protein